MYQNNLFNQGNNMALEMQVHQAFLNSPEGKEAEQIFVKAKKEWWETMNNPQAKKEVEENDKLNELENKINLIVEALDLNKKEK